MKFVVPSLKSSSFKSLLGALSLTVLLLALSNCVVEEAPTETGSGSTGTLPPDPGAAGNASLQGVDSDSDQVRDDVQIHLHDAYSDATVRAATRQLAKALNVFLVTGVDSAHAVSAAVKMNQAIDCLYSLDASTFDGRVDDVEGAVVNTDARIRAYSRAGAFLSGATFSVSTVANNAASCQETP